MLAFCLTLAGRRRRARGFTLVETTAVIAITGALAAAALPRLTAMGGEARIAMLDNARGALSSVSVMAHAKFLINGDTTQTFEDSTVALVNGYPAASQATVDAAGLSADYVVYPKGTSAITLVPRAMAARGKASSCFLVYEQAAAPNTRPSIRLGEDTTAESCT